MIEPIRLQSAWPTECLYADEFPEADDQTLRDTVEGLSRLLYYIEGWHAITEANRIFGFDGWDREKLDAQCIW